MEKLTPAPLLISLVYEQLRSMVAERAAPGKPNLYGPQMAPAVVGKILAGGARGWFPDKDEALMRSLASAIA